MDVADLLVEEHIITDDGLIIMSLASHGDGTHSVVARLAATGRRVGYLRCACAERRTAPLTLDPSMTSPAVGGAMRRLLGTAANPWFDARAARFSLGASARPARGPLAMGGRRSLTVAVTS